MQLVLSSIFSIFFSIFPISHQGQGILALVMMCVLGLFEPVVLFG